MKKFLIPSITPSTAMLVMASACVLTWIPPAAKAQSPAQATPAPQQALIVQDHVALRASSRDSAAPLAQLWQGELVEVRGERLDYVQVWDYKRERGGFVRANQLRRVAFTPADADNLLAVLRFVKDTPGSEGLSFGYAAAWLKAAPAAQVNSSTGAEVLDAIGGAAERLARRASVNGQSKTTQETIAAQLDAAKRYGIRFDSYEQEGKITLCYDGDVYARLLALPHANNEQRSRAALALTRSECEDPQLALKKPIERSQNEEWRAQVLDKADTQGTSAHLANRIHLRRANVWSTVAYDRARSGKTNSVQAAQRALDELAKVSKADLPDDDQGLMNDAVMRVNASRWAAVSPVTHSAGLNITTTAGVTPGETCVSLIQGHDVLAKRCSFGVVWQASFSKNRETNAAALAVQTQVGWREMWVFRKQATQDKSKSEWSIDVLVPSAVVPELGYVELAGWVPGGQQMLLAREARGEGKYKRSYEVMDLSTLAVQRQASDPSILGAFQRWQQPQWKQMTVSLR